MEEGRAHHHPNVHDRFRSQTVRWSAQDVAADFHDVAKAAAAKEEVRGLNAGFRGLVLQVKSQGGVAGLLI